MAAEKAAENYLVVLTFQGTKTAAAVYAQLEALEKEHLASIADAIIIERDGGEPTGSAPPVELGSGQGIAPTTSPLEDQVRVIQTHGKKGKYAAGGAGIGLLAGFLLGGPIGAAVVGGSGRGHRGHQNLGIDDKNLAAIDRGCSRIARRCWCSAMHGSGRLCSHAAHLRSPSRIDDIGARSRASAA